MKKNLFVLFLLILSGFGFLNAKTGPAQEDLFYPYQDEGTGLYGIKYNDEIVMLPYFEKLTEGGREPIFYYYDENDKAGIFTLEGFITAPVFDQIKKPFKSNMYRLGRIGNTWKIITKDELLDLPFECDDIFTVWDIYIYNNYAPVNTLVLRPAGGSWSIYTPGGIDLLKDSKITDFKPEDLNSYDKSKKIEKAVKKAYKNLRKSAKNDQELLAGLRFPDNVKLSLGSPKTLSKDVPSRPIVIEGFEGVINEMGIIDIPFRYNFPGDILKRDPQNLYALEQIWVREVPGVASHNPFESSEEFDEIERMRRQRDVALARVYERLAKEAIRQGWDIDSPLVKSYVKAGDVKTSLKQLNDLVAEQEAKYERNRCIDAIGNTLSGLFMQAAETFGGGNTQVASSYSSDYDTSTGSSSYAKESKGKAGEKYNVSEQVRCNADKRVYSRYESMVSKAKTHGNASTSEIEDWQNKMKSLRTKWEAKGYSFPKSTLEN